MSTTAFPLPARARVRSARPRAAAARLGDGTVARVTRLAQVTLGLIWLLDGALQFQPYMFGKTFITGVIDPNAVGQPAIIAEPITWIANLIAPHVTVFNAFAATLQVAIGLGLLYRRTVKPALVASFVWALGIWFTGEGLGMILTGNASPLTGWPGAALLYVIAGLMCWPRTGKNAAVSTPVKRFGLLGELGARRAWAALWLGSAALWLLPANDGAGSVHDAIAAVPSGAGWLSSLLNGVASAAAGRGTEIAIAMSVLSAAVGVGVLRGRNMRQWLALGIGISLVYWVLGQGLGGVFTGQATDVNAAPLVVLIGTMLYWLTPTGQRKVAGRRGTAPAKRYREAGQPGAA
jgi:hypothetical protein